MPRYLDPKNDLVFKKIFGRHPNLLVSFLNAVLPLPEGKVIERVEYLPTENVPELPKIEKRSIVDVRCYDQYQRHFIVEMQMAFTQHFIQRLLYNVTSVYTRQIKIAQQYQALNPVYGLSLVHEAFSREPGWLHHYQLMHQENLSNTLDDIHLVLLELPKFKPKTSQERRMTVLWLRFLTEINELTSSVDAELFSVPEIEEALKLAEESAFTAAELDAYSRHWDEVRTYRMSLSDKLEEGLEKGRAEGLAEGLAEGKAREQRNIAKKMLAVGLPIATIIQISGLAEEDILRLRE
ncbi:MAG: Rpn family recombination-promoting nuclease/putative transposase [Gammaproteobacteria bacterium]|nr:Rpn family recombination-promoting nuclease/putative transposase [Gammaproteobacteria bacterium]MCD8542765.1 Rpn family recombination-promoting nuclease/putative transposase [Gammaproteobacteria bacterium]